MNSEPRLKREIKLKFNAFDIIALVLSLALAIGVLIYVNITKINANKVEGDRIGVVYVKNEAIKKVNLEELTEVYKYTIKQADHEGMISDMEVTFDKEKGIAITYSNCQDHICIKKGYVNEANNPIVCLPNGVYVVIEINEAENGGIIG